MPTNRHNRTRFIWLHQAAMLVSVVVAFKISEEGRYILVPLCIGLAPLLLAIYFSLREPDPVNAQRLRTAFISSLIGGVLSIIALVFWGMWIAGMMLGGFH